MKLKKKIQNRNKTFKNTTNNKTIQMLNEGILSKKKLKLINLNLRL